MTEAELRERVGALIAKTNPDRVDMYTFRGAQFDHGLALDLAEVLVQGLVKDGPVGRDDKVGRAVFLHRHDAPPCFVSPV